MDLLDPREVDEVYRPLCHVLQHKVEAQRLAPDTGSAGPCMIGLGGSVAAGKSTTARVLQLLLSRGPVPRAVSLVTTDGFLYDNAELDRRGLMSRKGHPETYDRKQLGRFLARTRHGEWPVEVPVYSHLRYDIVPQEWQTIRYADVVIVEGLNVLNAAEVGTARTRRRAFDATIYLDAPEDLLRRWYIERFLQLRTDVFRRPDSYFRRYAALTDSQARAVAERLWDGTNLPNLRRNIRPTMGSADVVLEKGADHRVHTVGLRPGGFPPATVQQLGDVGAYSAMNDAR